jgi:hypothetical protein
MKLAKITQFLLLFAYVLSLTVTTLDGKKDITFCSTMAYVETRIDESNPNQKTGVKFPYSDFYIKIIPETDEHEFKITFTQRNILSPTTSPRNYRVSPRQSPRQKQKQSVRCSEVQLYDNGVIMLDKTVVEGFSELEVRVNEKDLEEFKALSDELIGLGLAYGGMVNYRKRFK